MNTNTRISKDFGNTPPLWLTYGRDAVEDRIAIRISDITREEAWETRDDPDYAVLDRKFKINGIEMELRKDPLCLDWYIELLNSGPDCLCATISFIKTRCRFGGYRYWFECPDRECLKKVGVLYKDGDDFKCRRCLNLDYKSHRVNYKSIEPTLRYMFKINNADLNFRRTYAGKDTRRMKQFYQWEEKSQAGFALYGREYIKKSKK